MCELNSPVEPEKDETHCSHLIYQMYFVSDESQKSIALREQADNYNVLGLRGQTFGFAELLLQD